MIGDLIHALYDVATSEAAYINAFTFAVFLAFGATGEWVAERSGTLNISIEAMFLAGAFGAAVGLDRTGNQVHCSPDRGRCESGDRSRPGADEPPTRRQPIRGRVDPQHPGAGTCQLSRVRTRLLDEEVGLDSDPAPVRHPTHRTRPVRPRRGSSTSSTWSFPRAGGSSIGLGGVWKYVQSARTPSRPMCRASTSISDVVRASTSSGSPLGSVAPTWHSRPSASSKIPSSADADSSR